MYLHSTALRVVGVATLTAVSGLAHAGGFQLIEHGASGLGNAYAGSAALADDASTVWFNPAGMLQLRNRELAVAAHVIAPNVDVTNQGTTQNTVAGGGPIAGDQVGSNSGVTFLPNFYYVAPINANLSYGIGVDVPYGSGSDYMSALLANSVDSGLVCFGTLQALNLSPVPCADAGLTPGNVANDSSVEVTGDSTSIGFNLGALFQPNDSTRIGVAIRSSVKHELKGTGKFENSAAFQGFLDQPGVPPLFQTGPGETEITTPATFSASVAHTLSANEKIQLLADVTWTQWSVFDELRIQFDNPAQPDVIQVQDWNDVVRVAVGTNYKYTPKITLRAGLAFDQSPIPGPTIQPAWDINIQAIYRSMLALLTSR